MAPDFSFYIVSAAGTAEWVLLFSAFLYLIAFGNTRQYAYPTDDTEGKDSK